MLTRQESEKKHKELLIKDGSFEHEEEEKF